MAGTRISWWSRPSALLPLVLAYWLPAQEPQWLVVEGTPMRCLVDPTLVRREPETQFADESLRFSVPVNVQQQPPGIRSQRVLTFTAAAARARQRARNLDEFLTEMDPGIIDRSFAVRGLPLAANVGGAACRLWEYGDATAPATWHLAAQLDHEGTGFAHIVTAVLGTGEQKPDADLRARMVLLATSLQPIGFVPAAGHWQRVAPDTVSMDQALLDRAIAFAQQHGSPWPKDFATQEQIFGRLLGPMPKTRADTNGVILRRGQLVATFGDVTAVDPTYSVAKSLLATVAAIAVRNGRIGDLDEPVAARVHDGGYEGINAKVTWRHHLQQESEWRGVMFGKDDAFLDPIEFGAGARKPRERKEPGTHYEYNDVRINRFALSLLHVFGQPVPDVFGAEVMTPIGASTTWRWIPYENAIVEVDGKPMPSISGGTRWGGGVHIGALDLARLGLLWQRGGAWGERQLLPTSFFRAALTASAHGPDYGFLFWLNTKQQNWPGLPASCFGARGAGNNTVFVSPEHELVIVWRWHATEGGADAKFFKMVIEAITR